MPGRPSHHGSTSGLQTGSGGPTRILSGARGLFGRSARQATWALTDQATASATNFITTVVLGRLAGPAELGLYSMAFSGLLWILAVQETLIMLPYTVFATRVGGDRRRRVAGSALLHHAAMGVFALAAVSVAALATWLEPEWIRFRPILLVLAAVVPFVLLRDFVRRLLFAHLELSSAAGLDLAVSVVQLGGLAMLAYLDALSAPTACAVIGVACAGPGGVLLFRRRRQFRPHLPEVLSAARASWRFGRWGFGSRVLSNINSDITMVWVVGALLGSHATGMFAACAAIVAFSNPFMLGSVHFLMPKICHDFARQGRLDRRRMVGRVTAVMTVIMAGFCLATWLFGGRLLTLLYGNPYRGHDVTLVVLALSVLATALSIGSSNALVAMDRPDLTFKATLLGMVAGLATVVAFAPRFGLTGVATGLLCGHLVDSGIRCSMFIHLTRDRTLPAAGDLALNRPGP